MITNDWGNVAVLVIDIQNDFCDDQGMFAKQGLNVKPAQLAAKRIQIFIQNVRLTEVPIIYTKQIESPDITPTNLQRQFACGKLKAVCSPKSWGAEIYQLQPAQGEHILEKHTYDPFSDPTLNKILRSNKIKTLIITGVNTDVCIDSTVRRAFTDGYQIVVAKDLVATTNVDAQIPYLAVFERFFGEVMDSKTILTILKQR